tara:strand:+ start:112 stop:378 length:267 start_codon:yes stop_codon:yes gene_type:complete
MNHTFDETEFPRITEYIADMAAEQAYLMLVEHGSTAFSQDFPLSKLIEGLTTHFLAKEEYEKCASLQNLQAELVVEELVEKIQNKTLE